MNKRINKIIMLIIIFIFCFICFKVTYKKQDNNNNNNIKINNILSKNAVQIELIKKEEEEIPETYTTMYASVGLNIRQEPNTDSNIVNTVNVNTELQIVDNSENNGWVKIKINDKYYYVTSKYISKEKVKIEQPKVTKTNNTTTAKNYNNQNNSAGVLTKSKGVNYYNGHKETWYSQRVLPGGGLKIPGRYVDSRGLVCDGDGYICVASSDYPKGTIVETSLGTGKVYDCGCASGTIDIYCNW